MERGHPNHVAGNKRPKHTIIPGMLKEVNGSYKGRARGAFGVMGGDYQPVGHTQVVTNMIDFGMDVQEVLDAPRTFFVDGILYVEDGISDTTISELANKGHQVERNPWPFGGGQIALIDWHNGTMMAGSESRKDGHAGAL